MVAPTFSKFPQLPAELQQRIWELASEATARVHFFDCYNVDDPRESIRIPKHRVLSFSSLAIPEDDPSTKGAIYRSAGGPPPGAFNWRLDDDIRSFGDDRLDVLGTFEEDGVTTYVSIRPQSDLVCLRPLDLATVVWGNVASTFSSRTVHVALEYNNSLPSPYWLNDCDSDRDKAACSRLIQLTTEDVAWFEYLWFIDYGIKRLPGVQLTSGGRHEFWGARGRYVEVWYDDPGWDFGHPDWKSGYAHTLVDGLNDREMLQSRRWDLDLDFEAEVVQTDPDATDYDPHGDRPYLGVLAFEAFD